MKPDSSKLPFFLKSFILSLFLSLSFLLFLSLQIPRHALFKAIADDNNTAISSPDLKIRPGYSTYDAYIQHQLNKTLNPKLREIWTTRDWERKVEVFANFFETLKEKGFLFNGSKALCVGARVGQEVAALRQVGVNDAVGIDLVPYPPLVVKGDFHHQPFDDETFDFEFSNVFDHALYPWKFIGEIERTLKPGGVCVLHVSLTKRADKYSANDLYSVDPLVQLFEKSKLMEECEFVILSLWVFFNKFLLLNLALFRTPNTSVRCWSALNHTGTFSCPNATIK